MKGKFFKKLGGFIKAILPLIIVLNFAAAIIIAIIRLTSGLSNIERSVGLTWVYNQMPSLLRDLTYCILIVAAVLITWFASLKYFKNNLHLWVDGEVHTKMKDYEYDIKLLNKQNAALIKQRDEYAVQLKVIKGSLTIKK